MASDKRKKKKLIILSLLLLGVVALTSLGIGLGISLTRNKGNLVRPALLDNRNTNIYSFDERKDSITKRDIDRVINNDFYETDITRQYGDKFKYPAWNYNYQDNDGKNRTQIIDGKEINAMDLVWNERISFNDLDVTYNDPDFILNEIKNGTLKKHPFVKNWFEQQILDNVKAIEKSFSIPSSITSISSLGLYLPPGEIATLSFDKDTLSKMKELNINNFKIILNSSFFDDHYDIDISNRYPFVKTIFNISIDDLQVNNGSFKFGSPFGGTVSISIGTQLSSDSSNAFYKKHDNYNFKVSGCLEMLSYIHNVTTEQDWHQQVQRVLNNEITAPATCFDFYFGAGNIPSTGVNEFANVKVKDIVYPKEVVQKWFDFLFVSEYFSSRDKNNSLRKIDFRFNDDIWDGAGAWGGGGNLSTPVSSARLGFLEGIKNWDISTNWINFHEINHSFEQNKALFQNNSHGKTNEASLVNLSLLNDSGRTRNIYRPKGNESANEGWQDLVNMWTTIDYINRTGNAKDEYCLQALLIYFLGTYNFIDYVRNDIITNPSTGGFSEIVELSDYFKLNFWPVLKNYHSLWNDGWPASYEAASSDQKEEIDRLNKSYKAFDFVANLYSVAPCLYNEQTGKYDYTNDMQSAIEIPANGEYEFDFEKGIISVNKNFSWSKLSFDSKSKLGATLSLSPSNNKKLIYKPNGNYVGKTDEFNVSITPDNFTDRPSNYVSEYIWKIKVRHAVKGPTITLYKDPNVNEYSKYFAEHNYDYMRQKDNELITMFDDPNAGIYKINESSDAGLYKRAKYSFTFVAPEDGNYDFQLKYRNFSFIINDNNPDEYWWNDRSWSFDNYWNVKTGVKMKKGETLPLSIYVCYMDSSYKLYFQTILNGDYDNPINVFDNCLMQESIKFGDPLKLLNDNEYDYKWRTLNTNVFQTPIFGLDTIRDLTYISKDNYTFANNKKNDPSNIMEKIDQQLSETDEVYYQQVIRYSWQIPFYDYVDVNFNQPTTLRTIIFNHRNDRGYDIRPTSMVIRDENDEIVWEGVYGSQFDDRGKSYSMLVLDKDYTVNQLKFEFCNSHAQPGGYGLTFDSILFSKEAYYIPNKPISVQSEEILYYGNWSWQYNDPNVNISDINQVSVCSNNEGDSMEFSLYAQSFDIIGQLGTDGVDFDVYIDGTLINNVNLISNARQDNSLLFSYSPSYARNMKIKIVNKSNNKLFINYIQTYGQRTSIEKITK